MTDLGIINEKHDSGCAHTKESTHGSSSFLYIVDISNCGGTEDKAARATEHLYDTPEEQGLYVSRSRDSEATENGKRHSTEVYDPPTI